MLHLAIICIACAVAALNGGIAFIERKNDEFNTVCLSDEGKQNITRESSPRVYNVDAHNFSDCGRKKITNRTSSSFYDYIIKQYRNSRNNSCSIMENVSMKSLKNLNVEFAFRKRNLLWKKNKSESESLTEKENYQNEHFKKKIQNINKRKSKKYKIKESKEENCSELSHREKKLLFKLKNFRGHSNRFSHYRVDDEDIERRMEKLSRKMQMENEPRRENIINSDAAKNYKNYRKNLQELGQILSRDSNNSVLVYNNNNNNNDDDDDDNDDDDDEDEDEDDNNNINNNNNNNLNNKFSLRKSNSKSELHKVDRNCAFSVNLVRRKKSVAGKTGHNRSIHDTPKTISKILQNFKLTKNRRYFYSDLKPTYRKNYFAKLYPYSAKFKSKINFLYPNEKFFPRKKRKRHNYRHRSALFSPQLNLKNWPFFKKFSQHYSKIYNMRKKRHEKIDHMSNFPYSKISRNFKKSVKSKPEDEVRDFRKRKHQINPSLLSMSGKVEGVIAEVPNIFNPTQKYKEDILPDHTIEKPFLKRDFENQMEESDFKIHEDNNYNPLTDYPLLSPNYDQFEKHLIHTPSDKFIPFSRYIKLRHALRNCLMYQILKNRKKRATKIPRKPRRSCRAAPLLCIPYIKKGQEDTIKYLIKLMEKMIGKPISEKKDIFERTKFKPLKDKFEICGDTSEDEHKVQDKGTKETKIQVSKAPIHRSSAKHTLGKPRGLKIKQTCGKISGSAGGSNIRPANSAKFRSFYRSKCRSKATNKRRKKPADTEYDESNNEPCNDSSEDSCDDETSKESCSEPSKESTDEECNEDKSCQETTECSTSYSTTTIEPCGTTAEPSCGTTTEPCSVSTTGPSCGTTTEPCSASTAGPSCGTTTEPCSASTNASCGVPESCPAVGSISKTNYNIPKISASQIKPENQKKCSIIPSPDSLHTTSAVSLTSVKVPATNSDASSPLILSSPTNVLVKSTPLIVPNVAKITPQSLITSSNRPLLYTSLIFTTSSPLKSFYPDALTPPPNQISFSEFLNPDNIKSSTGFYVAATMPLLPTESALGAFPEIPSLYTTNSFIKQEDYFSVTPLPFTALPKIQPYFDWELSTLSPLKQDIEFPNLYDKNNKLMGYQKNYENDETLSSDFQDWSLETSSVTIPSEIFRYPYNKLNKKEKFVKHDFSKYVRDKNGLDFGDYFPNEKRVPDQDIHLYVPKKRKSHQNKFSKASSNVQETKPSASFNSDNNNSPPKSGDKMSDKRNDKVNDKMKDEMKMNDKTNDKLNPKKYLKKIRKFHTRKNKYRKIKNFENYNSLARRKREYDYNWPEIYSDYLDEPSFEKKNVKKRLDNPLQTSENNFDSNQIPSFYDMFNELAKAISAKSENPTTTVGPKANTKNQLTKGPKATKNQLTKGPKATKNQLTNGPKANAAHRINERPKIASGTQTTEAFNANLGSGNGKAAAGNTSVCKTISSKSLNASKATAVNDTVNTTNNTSITNAAVDETANILGGTQVNTTAELAALLRSFTNILAHGITSTTNAPLDPCYADDKVTEKINAPGNIANKARGQKITLANMAKMNVPDVIPANTAHKTTAQIIGTDNVANIASSLAVPDKDKMIVPAIVANITDKVTVTTIAPASIADKVNVPTIAPNNSANKGSPNITASVNIADKMAASTTVSVNICDKITPPNSAPANVADIPAEQIFTPRNTADNIADKESAGIIPAKITNKKAPDNTAPTNSADKSTEENVAVDNSDNKATEQIVATDSGADKATEQIVAMANSADKATEPIVAMANSADKATEPIVVMANSADKATEQNIATDNSVDKPTTAAGTNAKTAPTKMLVTTIAPTSNADKVTEHNIAPGNNADKVTEPNIAPANDADKVTEPNIAPANDADKVTEPNIAPANDADEITTSAADNREIQFNDDEDDNINDYYDDVDDYDGNINDDDKVAPSSTPSPNMNTTTPEAENVKSKNFSTALGNQTTGPSENKTQNKTEKHSGKGDHENIPSASSEKKNCSSANNSNHSLKADDNSKSTKTSPETSSKTNLSDLESPTEKNLKKGSVEQNKNGIDNEDFVNGDGQVPTTLKTAVIIKGPKKIVAKTAPKVYSRVYPDSFDFDGANETIGTMPVATSKFSIENKTALLSSSLKPDIRLQLLAVCEGYLETIRRIKALNQTYGGNLDADLAQYCENIISQSFSNQVEKPRNLCETPFKTAMNTAEEIENNAKLLSKVNLSALQEAYENDKDFIEPPVRDKIIKGMTLLPTENQNGNYDIKVKVKNWIDEKAFKESDSSTENPIPMTKEIRRRKQSDLSKYVAENENNRKEEEIIGKGISENQSKILKLLKKRKRMFKSWLMNPKDQYKLVDFPETEYFDYENLMTTESEFLEYSGTIKPKRNDESIKRATESLFGGHKNTPFPVYARHYGYDKSGELREVEVLWRTVNRKNNEEKILKNMSVIAFLATSTEHTKECELRHAKDKNHHADESEHIKLKNRNRLGLANEMSDPNVKSSTIGPDAPYTTLRFTEEAFNIAKKKFHQRKKTCTYVRKPAVSSIVGAAPRKIKSYYNISGRLTQKIGLAKDIFQECSIEFLNYAVFILPAMFTILFFTCCVGCAMYILKSTKRFRGRKKRKKRTISSEETSETSEDSEDTHAKRKRDRKRKKRGLKDGKNDNSEKTVRRKFWNVLKMPSTSYKDVQEVNSQTERKNFLRFLRKKAENDKYKNEVTFNDNVKEVDSEALDRRELIGLLEELKKIELEKTGEGKEVKSVYVQYGVDEDEKPLSQGPEFSYPFEKNVFGLPKGYFYFNKKFPNQQTNTPIVRDFEVYGNESETTKLLPCERVFHAKNDNFNCFRHCDFTLNQQGRTKHICKVYRDSGVNKNPLEDEDFMPNESENQNIIFDKYKNVISDASEKFLGMTKKNNETEIRLTENASPFNLLFNKNTDFVEEMENMKHHNKKKYVRLKDDGVLCRL